MLFQSIFLAGNRRSFLDGAVRHGKSVRMPNLKWAEVGSNVFLFKEVTKPSPRCHEPASSVGLAKIQALFRNIRCMFFFSWENPSFSWVTLEEISSETTMKQNDSEQFGPGTLLDPLV